MPRTIQIHKLFKQGLKKFYVSGKSSQASDLQEVIDALENNISVAAKFNPHQLKGKDKGKWGAHIVGQQWVLKYSVSGNVVHLWCFGSHRTCYL